MKKIHLLIAGLLFCFSALAQAPATLNLNKGKVYQVQSKMTNSSTTNYMGQDIESKADITSLYELTVSDIVNDQYALKSTVKAIKLHMENMGQEMNYDSQDSADANNPMAASLGDVLNKIRTITIDKSGKLVSGADDSVVASPMIQQMENSGFGSSIAFVAIPAQVKAGDTWSVTEGDSTGIMQTTHYTVKSVTGNLVNLDFTGENQSNVTVEANGMEVQTKTQGTFSGTATVAKSGVLQSSKATIKTSGTVSVMGQEMPMEGTIESEATVTEMK